MEERAEGHDATRSRSRESGRPSDRLRREIERTRHDMDRTMDALGRKVGPRGLADHVAALVGGERGDGFVGELERQLRDHPVPVALMGLGLGWLAVESTVGSSSPRGSGGEREPSGESMTERAGEAARSAGEQGKRATERARERVESARSAVASAARKAGKEIGAGRDTAARRLGSLLDERPLALSAVSFGLGLAAGLSTPGTRWEDEALGDAVDAAKEGAGSLVDEGRERAGEALDAAVDAAGPETSRPAERPGPSSGGTTDGG